MIPPLHSLVRVSLALALIAVAGRPVSGAEQGKKPLILPESAGFRLALSAADRQNFSRLRFTVPDLSQTLPSAYEPPEGGRSRTITPLTDLFRNAGAVYAGGNAWLHLGAAAGTFLIIQSGLDSSVHNYFVRNTWFERYSRTAVHLGSTLPALLSTGLLGWGLASRSTRTIAAGSAVTQSFLLAVATTGVLKGLTGRPNPEPVVYDDNRASATFRFGILRGGVFHGWPSGHMLSNTAAVTSLLFFFNRSAALHVAGGAYLGYLFLSVASHGRGTMHWFSDAVAGALMGFAIGSTVGARFRRFWEGRTGKTAGVTIQTGPESFTFSFRVAL